MPFNIFYYRAPLLPGLHLVLPADRGRAGIVQLRRRPDAVLSRMQLAQPTLLSDGERGRTAGGRRTTVGPAEVGGFRLHTRGSGPLCLVEGDADERHSTEKHLQEDREGCPANPASKEGQTLAASRSSPELHPHERPLTDLHLNLARVT